MMHFTRYALTVALAALFLVPGPHLARAQDAPWPRTIAHEAGVVVVEKPPQRIVSTTPSVTGIVLAIGAPLVATAATTPTRLTDAKGFFSQWAQVADERGVKVLYKSLRFDPEAIIGANPDLVIISSTGADSAVQHYAELEAQGIPTLVVNYSNQSWQEIATRLGVATGHEKGAADAIARFNDHAAQVAAGLDIPDLPVSIVGYNLGGSYSIARPESPHAQLLSSLGFNVVGLPTHLSAQVTRRSDFEFVSRENLTAAIGGDVVFLLNGTDADVEAFLADPVLANLPAVREKRVYPLGPTSFRIDYYSGREMIDLVAQHFRKH
ncbi:Fe2+-enterobactin ABC transporter substrate-binding protein [Xanthobacter sp. TB0136]|uniref:Fe2+-enterobactin ABC transporter substrate-binding protein n=1 Tax=Xanthobacter sp. TB0136 TaxID=3459177 RepID=UPI00403A33B2